MNNTSKNFIWLGIIAFIAVMAYQSYVKRNPVEKVVDRETEFVDNVEEILLDLPESEYKGNSLANGASPFEVLYGRRLNSSTDHSLTIKTRVPAMWWFFLNKLMMIRLYETITLILIPYISFRIFQMQLVM